MQDSNVKDTYFRRKMSIRIGDKLIDLSTPIVMGILNATPDSFYSSSRIDSVNEALTKTEKMLKEGASIIDVGGYSSRPNAKDITEEEEIHRIEPIVAAISNEFPESIISIDTFRSNVAQIAIDNGAGIVNDISGFAANDSIVDVVAKNNTPYILMHMKGTPQTMISKTNYDNLFGDITAYFSSKIKFLKERGVNDIILDPGFGFAKDIEQNHALLRNMEAFKMFDLPILAGLSRKSMIHKKLDIQAKDSLNGTIALNTIALLNGANILRVHDVKEAKELIRLLS